MFYLITFATDPEKTAYLNAPTITLLGQGQPWRGYMDKLNAVRAFVMDKQPTDIVCFIDAYDVIQVGTNAEIEQKFRQMKADIVFTAETSCFPWSHVQHLYPFSPTVYRYLNSGGYVGYVHALKALLNEDFTKSPCDQGFMTYKFLNDYSKQKMRLDVECRIFQSTYAIPWAEFEIHNGRFYNRHTQTRPCLIHFNGRQHLMEDDTSIMPIVHRWLNTISDRVYSLGAYRQKFPTVPILLPEPTILELAKANAKAFVLPDQATILNRDQINHHAIFANNIFCRPIQKLDMEGKWAEGNRKIIEEFLKWLNLPTRNPSLKLDISLHDYVGYQSNSKEWPHSILGFSKSETDPHNVLIPDLYAMQNYKGSIQEDPNPIEAKKNRLLFIGSTTGKASVEENQRIQFCLFAYNKDWIEGYISAIVNFKPEKIDHVLHSPMTIPEQLKYRHLVVVDGNTACWDRLPWILASRSVCWKMESPHQCWYYPFLKPWVHYIPFTLETLEETWHRVKDDTKLQKEIVQNANQFYQTYLTRQAHGLYLATLLQEIYHLY